MESLRKIKILFNGCYVHRNNMGGKYLNKRGGNYCIPPFRDIKDGKLTGFFAAQESDLNKLEDFSYERFDFSKDSNPHTNSILSNNLLIKSVPLFTETALAGAIMYLAGYKIHGSESKEGQNARKDAKNNPQQKAIFDEYDGLKSIVLEQIKHSRTKTTHLDRHSEIVTGLAAGPSKLEVEDLREFAVSDMRGPLREYINFIKRHVPNISSVEDIYRATVREGGSSFTEILQKEAIEAANRVLRLGLPVGDKFFKQLLGQEKSYLYTDTAMRILMDIMNAIVTEGYRPEEKFDSLFQAHPGNWISDTRKPNPKCPQTEMIQWSGEMIIDLPEQLIKHMVEKSPGSAKFSEYGGYITFNANRYHIELTDEHIHDPHLLVLRPPHSKTALSRLEVKGVFSRDTCVEEAKLLSQQELLNLKKIQEKQIEKRSNANTKGVKHK